MDPLSLSASLATIVTLGASVATGLYTLAGQMGVAGRDVQQYSIEIQAFTTCLTHVGTIVERLPKHVSEHADLVPVINDMLDLCERVLEPLGKLSNVLNRYLLRLQARKSWKKIQSAIAKVGWVFKTKEEVLFYRSTVSFQHQILTTQLAILQSLAPPGSAAIQPREYNQGDLEVALEDLRTTVRPPASSLQQPNSEPTLQHRTDRLCIEDTSQRGTEEALPADSLTEAEPQFQGQEAAHLSPQSLDAAQSNALVLLHTNSHEYEDDGGGLTEDEAASLDQQIQNMVDPEGQFSTIKIEMAEELRSLARKTIRKTEKLLDTAWRQLGDPSKTTEPNSSALNFTNATSLASEVRTLQPPGVGNWTDAFTTLSIFTSRVEKQGESEPSCLSARVSFDMMIWLKAQIVRYDDFIETLQLSGAEDEVRKIHAFDDRVVDEEVEDDEESPAYCIALESGLMVTPEMWSHIILQPVFTEVFMIGRGHLQQWSLYGPQEQKGNYIRDFIRSGRQHQT